MKIAFIDKKDAVVKVENQILRVDDKRIPLRLLETVVLASSVVLSSRDMVKMTKEGITLILFSGRGDEMAVVQSAKSKNAELKLAQYRAVEDSLALAKHFVSQKVMRHTVGLEAHHIKLEVVSVLKQIEEVDSIESLLGTIHKIRG